jgi:hypothetical protein
MMTRDKDAELCRFFQHIWPDLAPPRPEAHSLPPVAAFAPAAKASSSTPSKPPNANDDSETESSSDDGVPMATSRAKSPPEIAMTTESTLDTGNVATSARPVITKEASGSTDDSESSPKHRPPVKKSRVVATASSDDSESEQRRLKTGTGAKRGTRQPLKRGGKKF